MTPETPETHQITWVRRKQIAELLSVSHQTVWNLAKAGKIRTKFGGIRNRLYALEDGQYLIKGASNGS